MLYENRKVIVPLRLALEFKLRTHEDQGLFPSRPVLTRKDPKELVERGQARPGVLSLQDGELLPKRQVFEPQAPRVRERRTIEDTYLFFSHKTRNRKTRPLVR
jgi:hypothetical protein